MSADLTGYPVSTDSDGDLALWCDACVVDPTNPIIPPPFWTEHDAAEQVTELCLANLVAIAEQHEREHHGPDEGTASDRLHAAARQANVGAGLLAMQIVKRATDQMREYDEHGCAAVNVRQVLGLLSPTWPDGNYVGSATGGAA